MSMPEQLLVLGALLIVVVSQLIGDVVLDEYALGLTTWLACIAVLVVVFGSRAGMDLPGRYRSTLTAIGSFAAVMGVWEFLADVDSGNAGAATWLFRIVTWAATALLALGAFQLSKHDVS